MNKNRLSFTEDEMLEIFREEEGEDLKAYYLENKIKFDPKTLDPIQEKSRLQKLDDDPWGMDNPKKDYKGRLFDIYCEKGGAIDDFAALIGLSPITLRRFMSGHSIYMSSMAKIVKFINTNESK